MRILVCIKQVPETSDVPLDEKNYTLRRDKAQLTINPADCAALEHAMQLKERCGAHVTVLTMGRPQAQTMLREVAARGADRLVLVTDPAYAGSDTLATADILYAAAEHIGGFDLILMGRRAIDGETGHVGPQLSVLLDASCVTNVIDVGTIREGRIVCTRLLEQSQMVLEAPLPALLTVCGGANALRPPSITGLRRAAGIEIETLTNADLKLPAERIGLNGSATRVRRVRKSVAGKRLCVRYDDTDAGIKAVIGCVREDCLHPAAAAAHQPEKMLTQLDGRIWVFASEEDIISIRTAKELIGAVKSMGASPHAVLFGTQDAARALLNAGAQHIYLFETAGPAAERDCAQALCELAISRRPEAVLFPATIRGRSIAPQCAAILRTGLTADCTELLLQEDGLLVQTRPAFGGTLLAEIVCEKTRPQLASVRPGVFLPINTEKEANGGVIERLPFKSAQPGTQLALPGGAGMLCDAQTVVAGGKGIGSREGFVLLERLASLLGGVTAATRSAVDNGFAEYSRQVGQTGVTLRPRVYIAFGISGAVQHLAGIKDSGRIVAVNTDPKAPLFDYADIGIVAPWHEVASRMIRELDRLGSSGSVI